MSSTMGDSDNGASCSDLHHFPNLTDACLFVRNTSSCDSNNGFINYTDFLYCTLGHVIIEISCLLLFVWCVFLFTGLATAADQFFCPCLAVISQSLKLSQNVAGVTFLALGNGAPDIFSAIAAISNSKEGDAGMAIGALFGGGVFVTTVVAGAIVLSNPFESMQRPFLRDVIFFLSSVFWAWYILYDMKITQTEAAGFIVLYVVYVLVVVIGRFINQRLKRLQGEHILDVTDGDQRNCTEVSPLLSYHCDNTLKVVLEESKVELEVTLHRNPKSTSMWRAFLDDINPIDVDTWRGSRVHRKFYEVFKSPLVLLLKLTVPIVNVHSSDEPDNLRNWNRLLNSLHCFTGPVFAIFATKVGFTTVGHSFPVCGIVMIVCGVLSVAVYVTSKSTMRPVYHTGFSYLAFIVAVVWIYSIANEIVNLLQTFGVVLDLSDAILGLTLLAWGNSIGDLVADISLARNGYPRMAISACFGGPLFNLLIGLGVPFTIACVNGGGVFHMKANLEMMVLAGGLAVSLISTLIIVPASKFMMSRPYGIYLLCLYVVFLLIAILTETNVIKNSNL